MALFGRRKPGFTREQIMKPSEIPDQFSDALDPAVNTQLDTNPKHREKVEYIEKTQQVLGADLPAVSAEAASDPQDNTEAGTSLIDYMESLPDVDDPFPPFEPEPEPEAPPELTEAQILAEYIRVRTANAELTPRKLLEAEVENLEQLLAGMAEDESCATIVSITGERDVYYYDNDIMTDNYARIAMLVADKNIPRTIAEMVRWNCRIYPSPTPTEYFIRHPYYYTKIQLDAALRQMAKDERYQDILSFNSARGNPYLYSSKEMSLRYAVALANGMEDDELNK